MKATAQNIMKPYKLLFILLLIQSCNTTTLTKKEASNLLNIQAEVSIVDRGDKELLSDIQVILSDGEKRILNDNIQIQLNGTALDFFVGIGNYHDKYPVYRTDDLKRKESYYFEIILPDSTKHPIAYIKPKKVTSEFEFSKSTSLDDDFILNWKRNNISADLELWKLVHEKSNPNAHSGGRYAKSTKHHTINNGSGSYKVPKSFYTDSLTVADYLKFQISHSESGLVNPKLRVNSKISYKYIIEETVEIK